MDQHDSVLNLRKWAEKAKAGDRAAFEQLVIAPETGVKLAWVHAHPSQILSLAWSPHGRRLASGGEDRTVRVWKVAVDGDVAERLEQLLVLDLEEGSVQRVEWSPDGRRLLGLAWKEVIRIWDAPDYPGVVAAGTE